MQRYGARFSFIFSFMFVLVVCAHIYYVVLCPYLEICYIYILHVVHRLNVLIAILLVWCAIFFISYGSFRCTVVSVWNSFLNIQLRERF